MTGRALPFLLGALAGALGGLMGVGGGILLVPLLVHSLRLTQHSAHGTSLAFIGAASMAGAIPYLAEGNLDLALAGWLAVGAAPGALLGAELTRRIPGRMLRRIFGILVLITAARILIAPPAHAPDAAAVWPIFGSVALGVVIGILGGLLGVGGGTLLVPILVLTGRLDQHSAQGVSLLMIIPASAVGALGHARLGQIARPLLPALMAGGVLGALGGGVMAHAIDAPLLSRLFGLFLIPVGAQMISVRGRATVGGQPQPGGNAT